MPVAWLQQDGGIGLYQKMRKKKYQFFINEKYYKTAGIVSTKIIMLINYQLLKGAVI